MRLLLLLSIIAILPLASASDWAMVPGKIATRWASKVNPKKPLPEYPRPQMVRKDWINLNGLWNLKVTGPKNEVRHESQILVPFPIESALSGVRRRSLPDDRSTYVRSFTVPTSWAGNAIKLNFGAVDHACEVFVDGTKVGEHVGGYTAFSFDVSAWVVPGKKHELRVEVQDQTGDFQPGGKQHPKPEGIWYEPTTGIWQTVWMEPTPKDGITSIATEPDLKNEQVWVIATGAHGVSEWTIKAGGKVITKGSGNSGQDFAIKIPNPRVWSPEDPFLYDLEVKLNGDSVKSYFGMRSVEIKADDKGIPRIHLNGQPYFMNGLLDQGYWPDGNLTAPTDAALKYDLEVTKKLGFNMVRKHVKVEPMRWYYHCDKLGLVVWQDMPSPIITSPLAEDDVNRARHKNQFKKELTAMIKQLQSATCIVMWVPFNEGWGQHDTEQMTEYTRSLDKSRLVNNASGWTDHAVGDVMDIHVYPGPGMPPLEKKRAVVLGEFGGLGLPAKGHMWDNDFWGYRKLESKEELEDRMIGLYRNLYVLREKGLSAAVYTQTTDVEMECNGMMSYDRDVMKVSIDKVAPAIRGELPPPTPPVWVLATAEVSSKGWTHTYEKPAENWFAESFNATGWKMTDGGFGTHGTPNAIVGTVWDTPQIWLRRSFTLAKEDLKGLTLRVHHDEDAEIYVNGKLVIKLVGYSSEYEDHTLPAAALKAFRVGENVLAVTCRQTRGGQFIDVGLVKK